VRAATTPRHRAKRLQPNAAAVSGSRQSASERPIAVTLLLGTLGVLALAAMSFSLTFRW
jgi:hypothetical protein